MLKSLSANKPSFKNVVFSSGFNVITATTADLSTDKDSRNGIGKSSLIEVIHFCLGADFSVGKGLGRSELKGWEFTLEVQLHDKSFSITRGTDEPKKFIIQGDTSNWIILPTLDKDLGFYTVSAKDLSANLAWLVFGISELEKSKYSPTFRMIIPYFARRGNDAFSTPFKYFSNQPTWQVQVANTFLLKLNYGYAREWQLLKDRKSSITQLKKTIKTGIFENYIGKVGQLESKKLRLERKVEKADVELSSYDVHPQYKEIEQEASKLTRLIHDLNNQNISDLRMVDYYNNSGVEDESKDNLDELKIIYQEAGLVFESAVVKKFEEVINFHQKVKSNRKEYIKNEVDSLYASIAKRDGEIEKLSQERAGYLKVLESHKALSEYNLLQKNVLSVKAELDETINQLKNVKTIQSGESELKIEAEKLLMNSQRDNEERESHRREIEGIFNSNTEFLYQTPGSLVVNIGEAGYSFDIDIERSGSAGVQQMEIFCYDLMLAELWKNSGPGFLIHDSTIFSDVDERQIAKAIELAYQKSLTNNFQYICCLNSDKIPHSLLPETINLKKHTILELKDSPKEDCLFGFRF